MGLYQSIAPFYDYVFPYRPVQKKFVLSSGGVDSRKKSMLDIGCGTGNLTLELSKQVKNIVGIDADREMINRARAKIHRYGENIRFRCLGMLEIQDHFSGDGFDVILSFGNTIAHLHDTGDLRCFMGQTRKILNTGGVLLLQIVNFDRVLKGGIRRLPVIENERIKFERFYDRHRNGRHLTFKTVLTLKKESRIIENRVPLYPILRKELEIAVKKAGYEKTALYGGFAREPWTEKSPALVVEAG